MQQITSLKTKEGISTGLIAVVVPKDLRPIVVNNIKHFRTSSVVCINEYNEKKFIELDENSYELLGLITPDTIGFDADAYMANNYDEDTLEGDYLDYETNRYELNGGHDSLYTLLSVNGLYWGNPLGRQPDKKLDHDKYWGRENSTDCDGFDIEQFNYDLEQWQTHQSNLLGENNILILKKI